jgi:magnesium transporter
MLKIADIKAFKGLAPEKQEGLFLHMKPGQQVDLLLAMPLTERKIWIRMLHPDHAVDVVQHAHVKERAGLLDLLDRVARSQVTALMAYAEDSAGGLMNPRYVRVRPEMTIAEATSYIRRQSTPSVETIHYGYVLGAEQLLLGVISCRQLLNAPLEAVVSDIMTSNLVVVDEQMHKEQVAKVFSKHSFMAIPVVTANGRMKGIVTFDDIAVVVQEEATKEIQKMGGSEALDEPYLKTSLMQMLKSRGGWLLGIFILEMFTTNVLDHFEDLISKAAVLAVFLPLVLSSGGNSGSQASTLVIRAMALGEVTMSDWWRVVRREVFTGLTLGMLLGLFGVIRILLWQGLFHSYGEHAVLTALAVALSLVVIVLWGGLVGSVLPFIVRRLGFDPATACSPFVATFCDVTGTLLYLSVALAVLSGTVL